MSRGAQATSSKTAKATRQPFPLRWLGLPEYPGIVVFFVSVALCHHLFDIIKHSDYEDMAAESLEAALLGLLAAAICVALVRRYCASNAGATLSRLSFVLLPGVLFVFAPFRYAQVCRWTGWCQDWSDLFLAAGAALGVFIGLYTWWKSFAARLEAWASWTRALLDRITAARLFLIVWVLCAALLAWRGYGRLAHPELFAEGGNRFVADALAQGWWSLGSAYAGYYHTLPRLVALLAIAVAPVAYIPAATTAASFLAAAAVSAFIVRPAFRWLIPSDTVRIVAALLLCLAPGLREVLGNLPNLHYLLFILLGLLVLKDPDEPYRAWELVLAGLAVMSSGMVAALAPAVLIRAWLSLSRSAGRGLAARLRANTPEVIFAAIILVPTLVTAVLMLTGAETGGPQPADSSVGGLNPATVLQAWGTVLASSFLLHPLAGTVAVTEIMLTVSVWVLVVISITVFAILFGSLVMNGHRAQAMYLGAWLSAPFALILLLALVRGPDLRMFLITEDWNWYKWWMRYNYLFAVSGVILWLSLLRPTRLLPAGRLGNVLALTLCVAYVSQTNWYFDIKEYGNERRWDRTSAELERAIRTGCPRSVTVQLYPERWRFTYRAAKENPECGSAAE